MINTSSMGRNNAGMDGKDPSRPTTLWVGDIEKWMDENYLAQLFGKTGLVLQAKIIRDRQTNIPVGYGFVQFSDHETAKKVLELYGNATNPGTGRKFRLNWGVRNAVKQMDSGPAPQRTGFTDVPKKYSGFR